MTSSGSTPYVSATSVWMSVTSVCGIDSVTGRVSSTIATGPVIEGGDVGVDVVG